MNTSLSSWYNRLLPHWSRIAVFVLAVSSFLAGYDTLRNKGKILVCDMSDVFGIKTLSACDKPTQKIDIPQNIKLQDKKDKPAVAQKCTDCTQIGVNAGTTYIFNENNKDKD